MRDTLIARERNAAGGPLRAMAALGSERFLGAMPAWVETAGLQAAGAKVVLFFPHNAEAGMPTHRALIALFDARDATPLAIVEGETITARRTAAASVVATERLAARPRGRFAILGAGVQGIAHLEAFADTGAIESLAVWSRDSLKAHALADRARRLGIDTIEVGETPAAAAAGAGVVITATSTVDPILSEENLDEGTHVNAVGSCTPGCRELSTGIIAQAAVYCDSHEGAEKEAGDLILAARELGRERIEVTELGEMLAEPGRPVTPARFTIFESLGIGVEDVACAAYVLRELDRG